MKTIKIPNYRSPYEVIVNGVKQIYSAGATVEVADEIADIIEASEAERQTKAPAADSGIKFSDIEDKPFTTVGGDTLTWDGNTEGLTVWDLGQSSRLYKVSDVVISASDLSQGYMTIPTGEGMELSEITMEDAGMAVATFGQGPIIVSASDEAFAMISLPGGTYFAGAVAGGEGYYVQSLTIPGYDGFPKRDQLNESALPYLTDANGVQYKLTVSTDGVLSAVAV